MKFSNFRKIFWKISEILTKYFRWKNVSMKNYSTKIFWSCISIPNFPKIPKIVLRKLFEHNHHFRTGYSTKNPRFCKFLSFFRRGLQMDPKLDWGGWPKKGHDIRFFGYLFSIFWWWCTVGHSFVPTRGRRDTISIPWPAAPPCPCGAGSSISLMFVSCTQI